MIIAVVQCTHWQDCGIASGGCCAIGYKKQPSVGACRRCDKYEGPPMAGPVAKRVKHVPRPQQPLKWPDILRDDPATKVCEACDQFGVRRSGCPACKDFPGCASKAKYQTAVLTRSCKRGRLQHLPPHALHAAPLNEPTTDSPKEH